MKARLAGRTRRTAKLRPGHWYAVILNLFVALAGPIRSARAQVQSDAVPSVSVFDSRSVFSSMAGGSLSTDDYEDPGYSEFQDDATMNAVKGLTRYTTTFFKDFDEVIATPNGHIYAGGFTSGSFELDFTAPSLGGSGVLAVGFDYSNNIPMPYQAFVIFADGSSENFRLHFDSFAILSPLPNFFGLTSSVEITKVRIGLSDGGATATNLFAMDNLTVAAPKQDRDGDGISDASDNCPLFFNASQLDIDENGRGDECECGDQDADGRVDVGDLVAINIAIFNPARRTPLCDANNDDECNVGDVIAANAEIFSPGSTSTCARQPVPGP